MLYARNGIFVYCVCVYSVIAYYLGSHIIFCALSNTIKILKNYKTLNFTSLPIPPIFQWQSRAVALLCPITTPHSIIFIIVEPIVILNMNEIFANGC